MIPYRFQRVRELEPGDNKQRVNFEIFFLIRYDEGSRWLLRILWTDGTHFTLTGNVNSKNCVHWIEENTHGLE